MGYDLHLTRAEDWADEPSDPITPAEFEAACRAVGVALRPDGDSAFQIGRHPERGVADLVSAAVSDGQVTLKPFPRDEDTADRVTRLAVALRARLQGDDGEVYDRAPVAEQRRPRRRLWQRRQGEP